MRGRERSRVCAYRISIVCWLLRVRTFGGGHLLGERSAVPSWRETYSYSYSYVIVKPFGISNPRRHQRALTLSVRNP